MLRGILLRLTLIFSGVLLVLVILEVGLRMTGVMCSGCAYLQRDPITGYTHIPEKLVVFNEEGYGIHRINRDGYDDSYYSLDKSPGTFRVAVLGDSIVEGLQVMPEMRFTEILEKDLAVEVLNFGLGSSGTDIQLLRWRHKVRQYQPDAVILIFTESNDVSDNAPQVFGNSHPGEEPYFVIDGGVLQMKNADAVRGQYIQEVGSLWGVAKRWIRANLFLGRLLSLVPSLLPGDVSTRTGTFQAFPPNEAPQSLVIQDEDCLDDDDYLYGWATPWAGVSCHPYFAEALDVTEALILALRAEVENSGARFLLVSVSDCETLIDYDYSKGSIPNYSLTERLEVFTQNSGIDFLPLVHGFSVYSDPRQLYINCPGHLSQDGHKVAAGLIKSFLMEHNVLPG